MENEIESNECDESTCEDKEDNIVAKENEEEVKDENEKKNEEMEKQLEEEKEMVDQMLKEATERCAAKSQLRSENQNAAEKRPEEEFFHKLDSSLKKNTAFVKKLGKLTEQQRVSLSNEFKTLNLTRFIQEVVSTLTEAKLKMSDIPCAVHICSLMHLRYADYTPLLIQALKRTFQQRNEDKTNLANNMSKLRTDLRFASELTVAGILTDKEGLKLVYNQLIVMTTADKDKHELLSVVISLCKHCGEDLAGIIPRKSRTLTSKFDVELPKSNIFAPDKQKFFYNALLDYWNSVCDHLLQMHRELQKIDRSNRQILQNKGELHEDRTKNFREKQSAYMKLLINCNTLADLLDVDTPNLPNNEIVPQDADSSINIYDPAAKVSDMVGEQSPWEDEDQQAFYTNLLDLKAIIPGILFKDSASSKSSKKNGSRSRSGYKGGHSAKEKPVGPRALGKGDLSIDRITEEMADVDVATVDEAALTAVKDATEAANAIAAGSMDEDDDDEDPENEEDIEKQVLGQDNETEEEEINMGMTMKLMMENFIQSLQNCVNRDLIDKAAQDFCMNLNTRANRKKLVRVLFNVHRSRLDLLPFYGRLVATLHPCMPSVAENLATMLLKDYRFHMRKKDQIHIESKVKTVRFIAEMTKFGMIPHSDTLSCLKQLIHDFSPHAIEMTCALLEVSGCFLLRTPETHLLSSVLLQQLMRKRTAKLLDTRYSTMIDNAYYYCNPPEVEKMVQKPRPPLHDYIRKLIYKDLSKSNVEKVLRQMRKLPWNLEEIKNYIIKCLTHVWNIKFNTVHCLASLVAGLVSYHDDVGIKIVDDVLEEVRMGMEINHPKFNQRRVSAVKYLGELYNYRMLDSTVVFNTLYSFITFDVTYDHQLPSYLDPPENLFRIRMVCVLLETCGQYFDRGTNKKKLDYFLQYFQRYIWFKKSQPLWSQPVSSEGEDCEGHSEQEEKKENCLQFPVQINYLVQDTIELLRPKMKFASSMEEATKAVQEVEKEILSKLAEVAPENNYHSLGDIPEKEPEPRILPSNDQSKLETIPENREINRTDGSAVPATSQSATYVRTEGGSSQSGTSDNEDYSYSSDEGESDKEEEERAMEENEVNSQDEEIHPPDEADGEQAVEGRVRQIHSEEDMEFQKAFDNILFESLQARKTTQVQQQDMTVPVSVKKSNLQNPTREGDSVKFLLLTKKGNKQALKPLLIPKTEHLAASLKDRAQAEQKQKEELKKITLSINERQVEEEHQQELINYARCPPANMNRERRVKYQPPKGAPNADLIFNTGGRKYEFMQCTTDARSTTVGKRQKKPHMKLTTWSFT